MAESMSPEEAHSRGYLRAYPTQRSDVGWYIVKNWEPSREAWSFRYGPLICGAMSGLTCFPIFGAMRKMYNLDRMKVKSGISFKILPLTISTLSATAIQIYNAGNVILGEPPCSVCHEIRSVSAQVLAGVFLPVALSVGSMSWSLHNMALFAPDLFTEKFRPWLSNILNKAYRPMAFSVVAQIAFSSYLVYAHLSSWSHMQKELNARMESDKAPP